MALASQPVSTKDSETVYIQLEFHEPSSLQVAEYISMYFLSFSEVLKWDCRDSHKSSSQLQQTEGTTVFILFWFWSAYIYLITFKVIIDSRIYTFNYYFPVRLIDLLLVIYILLLYSFSIQVTTKQWKL